MARKKKMRYQGGGQVNPKRVDLLQRIKKNRAKFPKDTKVNFDITPEEFANLSDEDLKANFLKPYLAAIGAKTPEQRDEIINKAKQDPNFAGTEVIERTKFSIPTQQVEEAATPPRTFNEAFADAKAKGLKVFMFNGKPIKVEEGGGAAAQKAGAARREAGTSTKKVSKGRRNLEDDSFQGGGQVRDKFGQALQQGQGLLNLVPGVGGILSQGVNILGGLLQGTPEEPPVVPTLNSGNNFQGGGDIEISGNAFKVKGNPREIDGETRIVAGRPVQLSHDEIVEREGQGAHAYSSAKDMPHPVTGQTFAQVVEPIIKGKAKAAKAIMMNPQDPFAKNTIKLSNEVKKYLQETQTKMRNLTGKNNPQQEYLQRLQGGGAVELEPDTLNLNFTPAQKKLYNTLTEYQKEVRDLPEFLQNIETNRANRKSLLTPEEKIIVNQIMNQTPELDPIKQRRNEKLKQLRSKRDLPFYQGGGGVFPERSPLSGFFDINMGYFPTGEDTLPTGEAFDTSRLLGGFRTTQDLNLDLGRTNPQTIDIEQSPLFDPDFDASTVSPLPVENIRIADDTALATTGRRLTPKQKREINEANKAAIQEAQSRSAVTLPAALTTPGIPSVGDRFSQVGIPEEALLSQAQRRARGLPFENPFAETDGDQETQTTFPDERTRSDRFNLTTGDKIGIASNALGLIGKGIQAFQKAQVEQPILNTAPITRQRFSAAEQLRQNQRNFQTQVSNINSSSFATQQALRQASFANRLDADSSALFNNQLANKQAQTQFEERLSARQRENNAELQRVRDLNTANRVQRNRNISNFVDSVGRFGASTAEAFNTRAQNNLTISNLNSLSEQFGVDINTLNGIIQGLSNSPSTQFKRQ